MKIKVDPGICGLKSIISLEKNDDMTVKITANTKCQYVKEFIKSLENIDPYDEVFKSFNESAIYKAASETLKHLACPVPSACIKLVEAENSLALPKDVSMEFIDDE